MLIRSGSLCCSSNFEIRGNHGSNSLVNAHRGVYTQWKQRPAIGQGSRLTDLFSHILDTFSRFTLSSALDIFIVTVLFYGVLMLVRGTRADQVLRGVILLFIFFSIVAAAFQLTMVDWLL